MTVYEKMQIISKNDFIDFCLALYWKAFNDGIRLVDDEPWIIYSMSDSDFNTVIEKLWEDATKEC